jgi:hypothetical protein
MKPLRTLTDQLVERRLWPLALVLVAGIVAVPVLLATGPGDEPAPPPAAAASASTPAASAARADLAAADTAVVTEAGTGRGLAGAGRRDPFVQRGAQAKAKDAPPAAETPSSGSGPATTSPAAEPASTESSTGPAPETTAPAPIYLQVSVDVAFGRVGRQRPHRGLPRLTPLPSPADPVVIFLGLVPGTKTAVFLVSSDVHPDGDGSCRPSRKSCQTVHLKPGGREFFDVADPSGNVVEYQLDYTRATLERVQSKAEAGRNDVKGEGTAASSAASPSTGGGGGARKARGASRHRVAAVGTAVVDAASAIGGEALSGVAVGPTAP